jgi:metal-responsive CopG/Arc/MetJ family transcriptional regulator
MMGNNKKIMCSVKMEPELIAELDEVAKAHKMSRSNLLREFAKNASSFFDFLAAEKTKQEVQKITSNGILSKWVLEHTPEEVDSKTIRFLEVIMRYAAEIKEAHEKGRK